MGRFSVYAAAFPRLPHGCAGDGSSVGSGLGASGPGVHAGRRAVCGRRFVLNISDIEAIPIGGHGHALQGRRVDLKGFMP